MTPLENHVHHYLSRELNEVKNSAIAKVESSLSLEERTIIYKYTEDGYELLNEALRTGRGQNNTAFGIFLDKTLAKLPNHEDIIYRAVNLTIAELQIYLDALTKSSILVEHSFISTSSSKHIAYEFGGNCLFRIISRTGKNIAQFAKYGIHHPQNEKEILFRPNRKFKVLEVTVKDTLTLITLEEVKQ